MFNFTRQQMMHAARSQTPLCRINLSGRSKTRRHSALAEALETRRLLTAAVPPIAGNWKLAFGDNFSGSALSSPWVPHEWWSTGSTSGVGVETDVPGDVTVGNGQLTLTAQKIGSGSTATYTSGLVQGGGIQGITTSSPAAFLYGYAQATIQIPAGQGFWPAFWLMPEVTITSGVDRDSIGEIDVMEILDGSPNTLYGTLHADSRQVAQSVYTSATPLTSGWHTYGIDWQPGSLTWYVDGVAYGSYTGSLVPSTPMYPILDLGVGGSWGGMPNASTVFPAHMNISGVQIWQSLGQGPSAPDGVNATSTPGAINLAWNPIQGADSYDVYRGTVSGGEGGTPLASGLTMPSYVDTSAVDGTTYYYEVTAVDSQGQSLPSDEVNAMTMPAAALSFALSPTGAQAGAALPDITVDVVDSGGLTAVNNDSVVTLRLNGGTFADGSATVTASASEGIATFANIVINAAGDYTLTASSGSLATSTSGSIAIAPGAASQLVVVTQPSATADDGVPFQTQPVVEEVDSFGNVIANDNSATVTASIAGGAATLGGTTTVTLVSGVATFTNLYCDGVDTTNLVFASSLGGVASAISDVFSVGKMPATLSLSNLTQYYDGLSDAPAVTTDPTGLNVAYTYMQGGNPVAAPINAGVYTVIANIEDPNYQGSAQGTLVIAPAFLTISASNASRAYGQANPQMTASYSGFVDGQSVANLSAPATLMTAASASSPVGEYVIDASGVVDPNYQINYMPATLTVAAARPSLSWKTPQAISYGALIGNAQLDASATVPGTFTYQTAAGTLLNAGRHTLLATFTPTDSADYTSGSISVTLTVTPAVPVLTLPTPPSKLAFTGTSSVDSWIKVSLRGVAGGASPTGAATLVYFKGSSATGTGSTQAPVSPGTYTVIAKYGGDSNYQACQSAPVTFTITRAAPTLKLPSPPTTIVANGTTSVTAWIVATITGASAGPAPTGQISLAYYAGDFVSEAELLPKSPIDPGTYTVVATYAGDSNYSPVSVSLSFTIKPAK